MAEWELCHYGVKGMKWGVRRYQNKDGSLTPRGERRFKRVEDSRFLSKVHTDRAYRLLKKNKRESDATARQYGRGSTLAYKKADKLVWKSEAKEAKGDRAGFEKYQAKAWKKMSKSLKYHMAEDYFIKQSSAIQKKIDDISSGTIKAGRDFIVDQRINLLPVPGGMLIGGTRTLIERNA